MNMIDDIKKETENMPLALPAIAIRDVVMFPGMSLPISVDRTKSVQAIEIALGNIGKYIILFFTSFRMYDFLFLPWLFFCGI